MKRPLPSHALRAAIILPLIALTGSGCGNWRQAGLVHDVSGSLHKSSSTYDPDANGGFPNDKGYTCSSDPDISTVGGADSYLICPGTTNSFSISLHGTPSYGSAQICVFPVDVIDASHAYPVPGPYGQALSKCSDISGGNIHLEFTGARFNAAFVVQASDQYDMAWCLQHSSFGACPSYSYQRFAPYNTPAQ